MAEPKASSHVEAEDILLAMDTAPNIEEHVRRLLLYIRAAEQTEKERDELEAKLPSAYAAGWHDARAKPDIKVPLVDEPSVREGRRLAQAEGTRGVMLRALENARLATVLREHSDAILEALAWVGDVASPEFKAAAKAVEEAIK